MDKHIYLIAGEASGDFIGAQLMKALKAENKNIRFSGVGGALMIAEGLESLFPMSDLSVMGVFEVLPRLKLLMSRIKQTTENIQQTKPDVVVTIDAPDFCFRVIKAVRKSAMKRGVPRPQFVHYVAPTVWAWRPKRAEKVAKFLDAMLCLFDFEPEYFEKEGLKAIAVGHPMMESGIKQAKPCEEIDNQEMQELGVFFGSRQGEIKRISPVILDALKHIIEEKPKIQLIVPTLQHLETQVRELLKDIHVPTRIITTQDNKWSVFKACDAAIAVSGTVGLELAACNVPHVIAYKMNALTAFMVRKLVTTKYAHLVNIMMQREVVPEFIQEHCDAEDIANEILTLLESEGVRRDQTDEFIKVRERMGALHAPSKTAAQFILSL